MQLSIESRVARVYAALGLVVQDASSIVVTVEDGVFGPGTIRMGPLRLPQAELDNRAAMLIHNIASLKDHLRQWCNGGAPFEGDTLINQDLSVAVIHDLWNRDKHVELDRPSRSRLNPRLGKVEQVMRTRVPVRGGMAMISMPTSGNRPVINTANGGKVDVVLSATVYDEAGNVVGELDDICRKAIDSWEAAFGRAGLQLTHLRPGCE